MGRKTKVKTDFSANPHNIQIGDWVIKETNQLIGEVIGEQKVIGEVVDRVDTADSMLQFWVSWFNSISNHPTPELAINLIKIPKSQDGYVGKSIAQGLISSMIWHDEQVKYEVYQDNQSIFKSREQIESEFKKSNSQNLVNIYEIIIDDHLQQRVKINNEVVQDYAIAYSEGIELPPITVFVCTDLDDQVFLVDGFHRVEAAKLSDKEELPCKYLQGTYREAVIYSLSVNATHGLRRSNADKRKAVLTLLNDSEWSQLTTRDLAKMAKVSHQLVHNIRREITAKEKELKEKAIKPEDAIKYLDDPEEFVRDKPLKKVNNFPPDVTIADMKGERFKIEVSKPTLDLICKYLQEEDLITAEGAILQLFEELSSRE